MWERQLIEKMFKNSCILQYSRWNSALHIYLTPYSCTGEKYDDIWWDVSEEQVHLFFIRKRG